MKKIFLICCTYLLCVVAYAQNQQITGTVSDESGMGLPGVNVIVKGTTNGTITDIDGKYSLNVENASNATLLFSFIGYESHEVSVGAKKTVDVVLKDAVTELDEVVAVGYGSVKKKDLTGSVASVDIDEMAKVPSTNLAQALSGRISGVLISTNEGAPGASSSIKIRGGGSITQSNEPLYIIDGFPTEDGLDNLDPSDIESIDVLKDISSTAIYGARGANGVILVKTKGGQKGKTRVNYDGYYGVRSLANKLDVLNPYDFVLLEYERNLSGDDFEKFQNTYGTWDELEGLYKNRPGIDWQDEMFGRTAINQYHKISISGGSDKSKFNLAYSYNNDEGIMVESGLKKNVIKFKFDHEVSEKLKASVSINYTDSEVYGMGTSEDVSTFNKLKHTIQYRPTIGKNGNDRDLVVKDEDPLLEDESGNVVQNPLVSAQAEHRLNETRNLQVNGMLDYEILKGFHYKFTAGIQAKDSRRERFNGERSISAKRGGGPNGTIRNSDVQSYSYTNILSYKNTFNQIHRFNAMVAQEEVYKKNRFVEAGGSKFPNDDIGLGDLSLAQLPSIPLSEETDERLLSFFSRVNYSLMDKYLLTATFRVDGSSKFGSGNKYGYFPSASFAWRAGEEDFIKNLNIFSNLKLRLSYGVGGNDRIPPYRSLALLESGYYPLGNLPTTGVAPVVLANPDLKWETTYSKNIGLDLGFFNQKLRVVADVYQSNTKDLLLPAQIPMTSGYDVVLRNVGETKNKGLELSISSVNISRKDFEWRTDFNISFNKNEVVKLADQDFFLRESGWGDVGNDYIVQVGKAVGSIYGYEKVGLYQVDDFNYDAGTQTYTLKDGIAYNPNETTQPGYLKLRDISGPDGKPDGLITNDDRKIIGNTNPVHFGGITNTFTYKNFDLSIFMNWSYGNDVYNANKMSYTETHKQNKNSLSQVTQRWSSIDAGGILLTDPEALKELNAGKTIPVWDGAGRVDPKLHSDIIEDGSFLRINNISLGYKLPKRILERVGINSMRVYTTVSNIHTFTKYSGYDPDVSTRNSSGVTPGVDWGAYPRSKSIIFGVNLSL
ncbi:MAG: TonB-dependent receptor [Marinifilum sp.]|jgi:TonB-linked SusC/RagA family outer membrane protein|nr:TonB-dependent receptor [Marinifilum sp.]